jgi:hypothetical protein
MGYSNGRTRSQTRIPFTQCRPQISAKSFAIFCPNVRRTVVRAKCYTPFTRFSPVSAPSLSALVRPSGVLNESGFLERGGRSIHEVLVALSLAFMAVLEKKAPVRSTGTSREQPIHESRSAAR